MAQTPSAQPMAEYVFTIEDFSKLLQSHVNPYQLTHGDAVNAQNLRANDQYGALSKRTALNLVGTCGHTSAVTSLHRYYKSDSTKFTITTSDAYVDYISDTGTCTNLLAGESTGKRWSWITYKNWAIGTDGFDLPIKWDGNLVTTADTSGARSAGFLTTQLGAPFAKLAVGAGLTASRWYTYVMAYYDGVTYKYSTARSNPILTGAATNDQIALTDIPLGLLGTTHRYLYRTKANTTAAAALADNSLFLVTDIADNATTTYTDSSSDATIGADTAPTRATVTSGATNWSAPHGKYLFIFNDYIWLANDPSGVSYGKSNIYVSKVTNPDIWATGTDFFLIRPDDGDEITGITSFLGTFTTLKTNTISKIYTNSANITGWTVSPAYSYIGSIAPYSIQSTPIGIIYLGRYGLYKFDGQNSSLISDIITADIRDINPTNYANAAAIYYDNEYRLAYSSVATGEGNNGHVLLFDLVRDSYVKDTENINAWEVYNSSDDFGGLYSGSSNTDGDILAHTTQPTNLIFRYLTDLTAGTFSHTVAQQTDTNDPNTVTLSLGSSAWSADASAWNSESTSTWAIDASPGTWISPIFQINANALSKLYWNEILNNGTATIAIRTASTSGGIAGASWSSEFSNPSGSDISGISADKFIQIRVTFSTSNFTTSPLINVEDNYLIKLVYSQVGQAAETSVPSTLTSGWMDLLPSQYLAYLSNNPKTIKEIDIYYEGTAGTINFSLQNRKGDTPYTWSIDLSKAPQSGAGFWGGTTSKVFQYVPDFAVNPNGDKYQLMITENGTTPWRIQRMDFRYVTSPIRPYNNN